MALIYANYLRAGIAIIFIATTTMYKVCTTSCTKRSKAVGGREIETSGLHAALFYIALHARLAYLPSSTFVPTHVRTHILQVKLKKEFLGGP